MADRIEDLLGRWGPEVQAAFLAAIKDIRDTVVLSRLEAKIRAGDIEGAVKELRLDPARLRPLDAALSAAYETSGRDASLVISASRFADRVDFDFRAFTAEGWLRQNNAQLIDDLLSDQGVMVREHLGQAVARGMNPHDAALELVGRINRATGKREGGLIGLSSTQAQWVRNYEADITGVPSPKALERSLRYTRFDRTVRKAISEGRAIAPETRRAMLNAYRNRALKLRAEQISQAESLKALGAAQIEAYQQAVNKGAIDADQVTRFWITKGDERVRPEHRLIPGMNRQGRGLNEPFQTPEGPTLYPPLGFGCRCRVRMEIRQAQVALAA